MFMFLLYIIVIFVMVTSVVLSGKFRKKNTPTITKYIRVTLDQRLLKLPKVFENVFYNSSNFQRTEKLVEANIVFFEKLTDYQLLYKLLPHDTQIYYSLASIDHISSKSRMYELLIRNLGVDTSRNVVPPTFLLSSTTNTKQLIEFANDNTSECLIFKSNVQQQKGIKIVQKRDLHGFDHSKYVVAQKLLLDPYTIKGRKINLRQYILVTCDKYSQMHFYAYDDGFVYYAPEQFARQDFDPRMHLTTGYGDRAFYKENPLTIKDFQASLSIGHRRRFIRNKLSCLRTTFKSMKYELQKIEQALPAVKFNILGVDLHVTSDLRVLVMEVNKGCDLTFKDSRDAELKTDLVKDTMNLVLNGRISNFSQAA